MMELDTFLELPTSAVAEIVQEHGPNVCVFPVNGTRRWFMLEYPKQAADDYVRFYLEKSGRRHLELYELFFSHGVNTLITPIVGPDILERGGSYQELLAQGLRWFAENEDFLTFYEEYDVRVRIYGDVAGYLSSTEYVSVLSAYKNLARKTVSHQNHRLFFGICAHDAAESVAEISVQFYQNNGRTPTKREIVEAYYGEYVESVDLFLGFDRPAAFDMPLIATGREDLYFMVPPSPYLDVKSLRIILYDHLYARRVNDEAYDEFSPKIWQALAEFYRLNRHHILGVGRQDHTGGFWYPIPQVDLPSDFEQSLSESVRENILRDCQADIDTDTLA